ncbi:hypothetical protein B0H13DRAFT_2000241 [Mycena leptocephala]|nr:hypothetical protein B0H13DRAFT_2000241 [Mycena leptocephala]
MGRWTQYDEDSYRLPEGMVRTGYDADTGCYTFSDRTGTYTGLPGSQYGPMYPAGTETAPDRILVPVDKSTKKRRASLPSVPDAFRSLRRSLTSVRRRGRDHSPSSDSEEPVLVSRPSSPLQSAESAPLSPGSPAVTLAKPSKTLSSTESASTAPPSKSKSTISASLTRKPSSPPPPPPKDSAQIERSKGSKAAPSGFVAHFRSASSSAPRGVLSKGHTRRAASEHIHAPRPHLPIAERFMRTAEPTEPPPTTKTPSSESPVASPATPGSANPQKLRSTRNRRHASEQTHSTSPPAASVRSTSPRPRTSAPLIRSLSTTA